MKDIEFYMADLDSAVRAKENSDLGGLVDKAFQIQESLELSMQLYVMSALLEVYCAENYDASYIWYVEENTSTYANKCQSRMLSDFSVLENRVEDFKGNILWCDAGAYGAAINLRCSFLFGVSGEPGGYRNGAAGCIRKMKSSFTNRWRRIL